MGNCIDLVSTEGKTGAVDSFGQLPAIFGYNLYKPSVLQFSVANGRIHTCAKLQNYNHLMHSIPPPENSPMPAKEMQRKQIDSAIQKHLDEISALKIQRNELAPIESLPSEIMTTMFLCLKEATKTIQEMHVHHFLHQDVRFMSLKWITVSHVNSRWRTIALNSHSLWTRPPFFNLRWAAEMIKRSKKAGLSVKFDFGHTPSTFGLLVQCLQSGLYIKELSLGNIPVTHQGFMNSLPRSLPQLQKLFIHGSPQLLLPDSVISGAGQLQYLDLNNCKVNWAPRLSCAITFLRLRDIALISTPTLLQFLHTLASLPQLEILDLQNVLPLFQPQNHCSRQIRIPKLQKLNIVSSAAEAASFFEHVAFPPSAFVTVQTRELQTISNFSSIARTIFTAISRSYSNCPSDLVFRSLIVKRTKTTRSGRHLLHREFELRLCSSLETDSMDFEMIDHEFDFVDDSTSAFLSLSLAWPEISGANLPEIFTDLLRSSLVPLENIKFVHLEDMPDFTPHLLALAVGQLPNVSRVGTHGKAARTTVMALQLPAAESMDTHELYFPATSVLDFSGANFSNRRHSDSTFEGLQDCLIQRYECGYEITRLSLEDCIHLDGDMVDRLKEIVVDVDWDHYERQSDDDC